MSRRMDKILVKNIFFLPNEPSKFKSNVPGDLQEIPAEQNNCDKTMNVFL